MLQNLFSLLQFRLEKWSFFAHSTTRNVPYIHPRLDSILELCRAFQIDLSAWCGRIAYCCDADVRWHARIQEFSSGGGGGGVPGQSDEKSSDNFLFFLFLALSFYGSQMVNLNKKKISFFKAPPPPSGSALGWKLWNQTLYLNRIYAPVNKRSKYVD